MTDSLILIKRALKFELKEGEIVTDEHSPCCNAVIKFTKNSGVYVAPGIYCHKCNELL